MGCANHHKTATPIARAHPTVVTHHQFFCAAGAAKAPVGPLPVSDNASKAKARSEAEWKRCCGLFSRQRCTTFCSEGGVLGTACEMTGGSSFRIALMVSAEVDL